MEIRNFLIVLVAFATIHGPAMAASQFYQRNDGTTIGTLYTTFFVDNYQGPYGSSAYRVYLDLDVDGTWRPSRHYPHPEITPCGCVGYGNWDSASQTLHVDTVRISGFDYTVDIEIKTDYTWRLISLAEHTIDLNGRWRGSYRGYQFDYTVTHTGNQVGVSTPDGRRFTGTIDGKTAVLTQIDGSMQSTTRATLTSKDSVTMTVLTCNPPSGYVCLPGVGESVVINRY